MMMGQFTPSSLYRLIAGGLRSTSVTIGLLELGFYQYCEIWASLSL